MPEQKKKNKNKKNKKEGEKTHTPSVNHELISPILPHPVV